MNSCSGTASFTYAPFIANNYVGFNPPTSSDVAVSSSITGSFSESGGNGTTSTVSTSWTLDPGGWRAASTHVVDHGYTNGTYNAAYNHSDQDVGSATYSNNITAVGSYGYNNTDTRSEAFNFAYNRDITITTAANGSVSTSGAGSGGGSGSGSELTHQNTDINTTYTSPFIVFNDVQAAFTDTADTYHDQEDWSSDYQNSTATVTPSISNTVSGTINGHASDILYSSVGTQTNYNFPSTNSYLTTLTTGGPTFGGLHQDNPAIHGASPYAISGVTLGTQAALPTTPAGTPPGATITLHPNPNPTTEPSQPPANPPAAPSAIATSKSPAAPSTPTTSTPQPLISNVQSSSIFHTIWVSTRDNVNFGVNFVKALPGAYINTALNGEQASAIAGFTDSFAAKVIPIGNLPKIGPAYGQDTAYQQGQAAGTAGAIAVNAVLITEGISGAGKAAAAFKDVGELIQTVKLASTAGEVYQVTTVSGAVTREAAAAIAQTAFAAKNLKNMFDQDEPDSFDDVPPRDTMGKNQGENSAIDDIQQKLGLSNDERDQLHEAITDENYNYQQIEDIARTMFNK